MALKYEEIELKEIIDGARCVNSAINIQDILNLAKEPEKIKKIVQDARELRILIIGKTGTGKSTLVNGLIGAEVAEVYSGLVTRGVSSSVQPYQKQIEDIDITVFDSPGLQDGSDSDDAYLEELHDKCHDVDLVVFAIRMSDNRFIPGNSDATVMVKFTNKFGPSIWKKTIIIVTCTNLAEELNPQIKLLSLDKKVYFFQKLMQDYRDILHKTLIIEANVSETIVKTVKVVPTGHISNSKLMDGTLWFSNFWLECLTTIPSNEARAAMIKLNSRRFRSDKKIKADEFLKSLEEQPIVVLREVRGADTKIPLTVGCVVGTACFGALFGAIGLAAGPVGLVGIPVGFFLGMMVGTLGAVKIDASLT